MIGISYMSRQVLRALSDNGPMLKSELNAIGITDTAAMPLQKALGGLSRHKFIASSLIKKTSETSIYQYAITDKGRAALESYGDEPVIEVPMPKTPSRTIWNSTMREPYRTGMGRAMVGLAMIGV